jgi:hypothetical protein
MDYQDSKTLKNLSHIPVEYFDLPRTYHRSCTHNCTDAFPEFTEKRVVYEQIKVFEMN